MTNALRLSIVAALSVSLAGCPGKHPAAAPSSCLPGCGGTRGYDAVAYALSGRFDWNRKALVATEEITLALPAGSSPVVELDAAVSVSAVSAGARPLPYAAGSGRLRVDLGSLAPGAAPVTFTVEYTAAVSDALIAAPPRGDDPVQARVVFTDSEPNRGHQWLVEKDDPSDPALFSVELIVAADEDVIANGERTGDAAVTGGRRVAHAMALPIPTYLMAFAAGQLERTDRPTGSSVPLSLWYRRGLAIDPSESLGQLAGAMASFEALVGPYPFSRYSLVLLPGYGGGMENATITFEGEKWSQGPYGFGLHAHELAHQWFGDRVTMHGYDDVWVKEGMATLLAAEASRPWSDLEGRGRLMASSFLFDPADAIVDTTLTGLDKYTSGPYERSAALITQVRARIGEAAFWARLRAFLDGHAQGSATGEQFVRAFSPELSEAEIQQVLAILPRFDLPGFSAEILAGTGTGGADQARLTLSDPARLVLAPFSLTVVDAAGLVTSHSLAAGTPVVVDLPSGGYLAPDEAEAHPLDTIATQLLATLSPRMQPAIGSPPGALFASRSAAHQERSLDWGGFPASATGGVGLTPGEFPAYYASLDSDWATLLALQRACIGLGSLAPAEQATWISTLAPIFGAPRYARPRSSHGRCGPLLGASLFSEFDALTVSATPAQLGRLEYLFWFDYGADGLAPLTRLALGAPSLKLRDAAVTRLAYQANGFDYSPVPAGQVADWRIFFRDRLAAADSYTRLYWVWLGVTGLQDLAALPAAGQALQRVALPGWFQEQVVCGAHQMANGSPSSWAAFQDAARPWSSLSSGAAALLANPQGCAALGYPAMAAMAALAGRHAPSVTLEAEDPLPPHALEGKGARPAGVVR